MSAFVRHPAALRGWLSVALLAMAGPSLAAAALPEASAGASCSCEQAREHVLQQARREGVRAEVQCVQLSGEPAASCPASTLRAMPSPLRSGPLRVVLRTVSTDGAVRDRAVVLRVALQSQAWVATSPIAAGEPLEPALLQRRDVALPNGVPSASIGTQPPDGRARRALRPGEPVVAQAVLPPSERRQGDAVEIVLREGAVTVAMPGVLVRDASVGQRARAQVRGRRDVLDGELVDPHTVVVAP